jgi:hypothetical protein
MNIITLEEFIEQGSSIDDYWNYLNTLEEE